MEQNKPALTTKTSEGLLKLTEQGRTEVAPWVSDIDSYVYAFTPEADAVAVAAAMARLSRNPNDLRTILAEEFLDKDDKTEGLLRRVVTQFGDDSVMQLYPMQIVFEGISNIATKDVEWGRLAAYLEQSTRYLRFDRKDEEGHYAYYTPEEFDPETHDIYEEYMDKIFDIYSDLYVKLRTHIEETSIVPEQQRDAAWKNACHAQACDGVRALLPASTKATVGFEGSAQAAYNLILHMNASELPEMNKIGFKTLQAVRTIAPVFFERVDNPERGELIVGHTVAARNDTRELAAQLLENAEIAPKPGLSVELLGVDGSEDELAAKILADASTYPLSELLPFVQGLDVEKKRQIIQTYVGDRYNRRAKPGRAFELPHYLFEIQCDYGAFRDIQRHRLVDGLDWQLLHTELGHVQSPAIANAGLEEGYERAFELSKELYGKLQERGYEAQAQYATLFGHIMRASMKVNARSLVHTIELRTTPQGHPSYRKVYKDMYDQIAAVHPAIAEAMVFVNQGEDEELARLGAERYNQAKQEVAGN